MFDGGDGLVWHIPLDDRDGRRQHDGKLLQQMGPVTCLFELLDDADDDLVIDALCVDLG